MEKNEGRIGQIVKCIKETDSIKHTTPLNELFRVVDTDYGAISLISLKTELIYPHCDRDRFILRPNKKLYIRIL